MESYSFLRTLADSWGLLLMTLFFIGIILWAFRPGSRQTHAEIAGSIFRNEGKPLADQSNTQRTEA